MKDSYRKGIKNCENESKKIKKIIFVPRQEVFEFDHSQSSSTPLQRF